MYRVIYGCEQNNDSSHDDWTRIYKTYRAYVLAIAVEQTVQENISDAPRISIRFRITRKTLNRD